MLEELRIRNFAIIDELDLTFAPGFNVITGETGAGKSIMIDALELLLGGKSDSGVVRAGSDRSLVEGVFSLDAQAQSINNASGSTCSSTMSPTATIRNAGTTTCLTVST